MNDSSKFKKGHTPWNKGKYVRLSPKSEFRKGMKPHNWKGGRINHKGYIYIFKPNHPNSSQTGYILEHRLVMETSIGRCLKPNEIVHHKDGNRLNNDISNLVLTIRAKHKMGFGAGYKKGFEKGFATAFIAFCLMNKSKKRH